MLMVAFLFLLAPAVVWIAVLIIQWLQPRRDQDPEIVAGHVVVGDRVEPRF